MAGFSLLINAASDVFKDDNLICDQKSAGNYQLNRFTIKKFLDDKLFHEDDRGIVVLEGVILNRLALMRSDSGQPWVEVVWNLYTMRGDSFFKVFRGSFSGCIYDRSTSKWIIFTDQLGTKQIYYYIKDGVSVFSSDIVKIYNYFREKGIGTKLNIDAAYMLLSYGYMLESSTLSADVLKLLPGNYIVITGNSVNVTEYYTLPLSNVNDNIDEAVVIDVLDEKFRNAVALQFDKDREYNYDHFVSLSGGLDSRMVSWVAHDMGYNQQVNFTFSQSDYLDETTPKKISADLKHEWLFKSLDNGLFMTDLDDVVGFSGGNSIYNGLAHSHSFYKYVNFDNFGLIHSGQIGDAVVATLIKDYSPKCLETLGGAYSEKFVDRVSSKLTRFTDFTHLERALLYQRAFNGANNGNLSEQKYSETFSPFYNIELFEYCLSISIDERMHHGIYKKWILAKYPGAARYVWEYTKSLISTKTVYLKVGDKRLRLDKLHHSILRKLGLKKKPSQTRFNMNPLDYWYTTNTRLRKYLDDYFLENIERLNNYPDVLEACKILYYDGPVSEKCQALTLLSAVKLHGLV